MFKSFRTSGRRWELRHEGSHAAFCVCAVESFAKYTETALNELAKTQPPFPPAEAVTDMDIDAEADHQP